MKQIAKKLRLLIASTLVAAGFVALFGAVPSYALDCNTTTDENEQKLCAAIAANERRGAACDGAEAAGVTNCRSAGASAGGFRNIIKNVINILSVIVGAVSVIMIIIGGFRYVVSNGDSNAMGGAKNTILYAIVGLVIVLFAQVIVAFVIDRATS